MTASASHSRPGLFGRVMFMACMIIAGEAIFTLPYHVARFFRPTMLEAFGFTNTELGVAQAVYGVVAMVAYFPGGALADHYSARKLMTASLVTTGLGGLYFATIPGYAGMCLLFGYWGLSSILLFWAALIRATREWGGTAEQGRAFGLLDGGRGLLAAGLAAAAVLLFRFFFPEDIDGVTQAERVSAIRSIILAYTATTFLSAVLVWFFVPEQEGRPKQAEALRQVWANIKVVVWFPAIWLQAAIIVCAYVAFKGLDNYSLFAAQGYGMNEVDAAEVSAVTAWVRPPAAIGAGLLADRLNPSRVVSFCFLVLVGSNLFFAFDNPAPSATWILFLNTVVVCAATFGLRGVYFALFEEGKVPAAVTGTAVGLVSVIGYTPDIFVAPIAGVLIDRSPGVTGHQHFFLFLAAFAALGLVANLVFRRLATK